MRRLWFSRKDEFVAALAKPDVDELVDGEAALPHERDHRGGARGLIQWSNVVLFIFCYWVAMIVNENFDVYLEGPMDGIWFWTVFGYGLAVIWLYRYRPQSLPLRSSTPLGDASRLAPQTAA